MENTDEGLAAGRGGLPTYPSRLPGSREGIIYSKKPIDTAQRMWISCVCEGKGKRYLVFA